MGFLYAEIINISNIFQPVKDKIQNVQWNIKHLSSDCNNSVVGLMMDELISRGKTRKYMALEKLSLFIEEKRQNALMGDFNSCKTILTRFPEVSDNLRQKYHNCSMYKKFYGNPLQI